MGDILIRQATWNDVDTLLQYEQGVIQAERPFDSTLKPANIRYYDIHEMLISPLVEIIVAEVDNKIIGCGYARIKEAPSYVRHDRYAYLGFLYVTESQRGKHIIGLIIEHLKNWAATHQLHEIRLEVYHGNSAALRAYEKAGFKQHIIEMRLEP